MRCCCVCAKYCSAITSHSPHGAPFASRCAAFRAILFFVHCPKREPRRRLARGTGSQEIVSKIHTIFRPGRPAINPGGPIFFERRMKICVLASGSAGNCIYVASGKTRILVDAGISGRQTVRRLEEIGVSIEAIDAICVSHEHDDHTGGVGILYKRHQIPVYANGGTADALSRRPRLQGLPWRVFTTGAPFSIGDLVIEPFSIPHDAYEPVGFTLHCEEGRIGIALDVGTPTTLVRERLRGCHALVVEANHDEHLLQEAPRPWALKQRIRSRQGHLSNRMAAEMLAEIASPALQQVFLGHLSEDCNCPILAVRTISEALAESGHPHIRVCPTYPDRVAEVWDSSVRPPPGCTENPPIPA